MKNVSEFTKTQALIDEYNKLKNKVPKLETQMKQNENRTKVKIEKLKSDMQENQEDVEYKLDRAAVEAEYGKRIEQEEKNLEEENDKIKEEINKTKEEKKFFCTDKNFKTITTEIETMKKEVEKGKLEIKRKEYEIKSDYLKELEVNAESDKENSLKWLESRKESEKKEQEIGKINKEINAMNKKIEEYSKFKGELSQQLSTFTVIDFNKIRERENNKTDKSKEEYEDIYSNSQDSIKAINIEAATGKAYISTSKNNNKEIDIKEAIEDRKGLYKRIGIKEIMQRLGIDSKIKQFALKRKMNPVILQAIHEDKDLTEEYIDCLIENRGFPFKYKNSLMNSSLSNKDTAFMNRIALKERKIEENEIVGAERLYKIKTFFKNIKNKVNKRIETRKVEMLDSAENKETKDNTKSKKEEFRNRIEKYNEQNSIQRRADKIVTELEKKYDEAYNSLSDEQKSKLSNMSIRDIQKLGFDYSTSVALSEKQEKNNDENGKEKDDER